MSFFDLFGLGKKGRDGATDRDKRKYYIIDGSTLDSSKNERSRLNPRNQVDVLRRLAKFVKKEQVETCVVFDGKALRDAPDDKKYQDILVRYAEKSSEVRPLIGRLCAKNRGRNVLVITTDKKIETEALGRKAEIMHSSTFRKALESNGDGGRDRSSGGNRRRQTRRPRNNNNNGGSSANQQHSQPAAQKKKTKAAPKDADPVSDLIDLV